MALKVQRYVLPEYTTNIHTIFYKINTSLTIYMTIALCIKNILIAQPFNINIIGKIFEAPLLVQVGGA